MKYTSLLFTLLLSLGSDSFAGEDAGTPFLNYTLNDFCLDLTQQLNNKNANFLISHIDADGLSEYFLTQSHLTTSLLLAKAATGGIAPPPSQQSTQVLNWSEQLSSSYALPQNGTPHLDQETVAQAEQDFINAINTELNSKLENTLNSYASTWKNTQFVTIDDHSAYCKIMGDPFSDPKFSAYALALKIEHKHNGILITDIEESNLYMSYSTLYRDYLGTLFSQVFKAHFQPENSDHNIEDFFIKFQNHNAEEIRRSYENLSPDQQNNLFLLKMYLGSIVNNHDLYYQGLKRAEKILPTNTPSYLLFDMYLESGNYAAALTTLAALETAFGYHPSLDILRIRILEMQHKPAELVQTIKHALEKDDGYDMLYWTLLSKTVQEQRFDDSLLLLTILKNRFNVDFDNEKIQALADYKALFASANYRKWRKEHR